MSAAPRVTAIVVSYNTRADTLRCLRSLRDHAAGLVRIVVVDNHSDDGSPAAVHEGFPDVTLLGLDANLGYAAANNRGLALVETPYALLLNSDAELRPGAVTALLEYLDTHSHVAVAAPRTLNSDGSVQISWGPDLTPLNEWRHRRWRRAVAAGRKRACDQLEALARREHAPDWLSGSCLFCRVESLRQVRFFDAGYFLYEEDADLCLRLRRAGCALAFVPKAEVVHHLGRSMAAAPQHAALAYHRSHLRYYALHNGQALTLLLRLWLVVHALIGWAMAGPAGPAARSKRLHCRALAALAVSAVPRPPAD
jgi:N-acetylglucosaminyl-diphospho-decaprenol L-rhamnosyltransferase